MQFTVDIKSPIYFLGYENENIDLCKKSGH